MRKAFKVATVFTGAAACAAAFMPAAEAAPTATAKTQQIGPDIIVKDCDAGQTTSVHFYWPSAAHHGPTCLGESGTSTLHGASFTGACTGNNWGWFSFSVPGVRSLTKIHFGQTEVFSFANDFGGDAKVYKVHISGWSGGWTCAA
jgi:hypothetical protein